MGSHALGGAGARLAFVAALLVASTGCGPNSPPPEPSQARASAGPPQRVYWARLRSVAALDAALADARNSRQPTVVIVFAQWSFYAVKMMQEIEHDAGLLRTLARARTVLIDETGGSDDAKSIERDLRTALKIPENRMPWVAFVDATGSRRPDLDIDRWNKATFRDLLAARLATLGLRD